MTAFDAALALTLGLETGGDDEGGFSDHAWDPGGKTRWGITEALATRYRRDVRTLTADDAREIYRREFWEPLHLDDVAEVSPTIAAELFDTAVNAGRARATRIAQEALAEIFDRELEIDGKLGPATLAAIKQVAARYEEHLLAALNLYQGTYYVGLLRRSHPAAKHAIKGWMRRLTSRFVSS